MEFFRLATVFMIGGVGGWVLELLFRRYHSYGKWVNPGFLVGPFLPLYAFGLSAMYYLCLPDYTFGGAIDALWGRVINILLIGAAMTVVELLAGLIFIKGMKIKLWDYSDRKGNFMGIICPTFSLIWTLIGALYTFLHPFLVRLVDWTLSYADGRYGGNVIIAIYGIGIFCGVLFLDCAYSFNIATKLRKAAAGMAINYEKLKQSFEESHRHRSERAPWIMVFSRLSDNLQGYVDEYSRKAGAEAERYAQQSDLAQEAKAMERRMRSIELAALRERRHP